MPSKPVSPEAATRPLSLGRRKAFATDRVVTALSAIDKTDTTDETDKDVAVIAALELFAERLARDAQLSGRLRTRYRELEALKHSRKQRPVAPTPMPISGPDLDSFNPYAKPDPYKLLGWYGRDQFRAVVTGATTQALRELADAVQAREPNTSPASRRKKQAMIDYIVEHVAGRGY